MKKFERFISLLLTLMMLFTGVVPAAAETISSAVQVRVLPASQYAGNAGINGMGELLTGITIKDEKGNTITDVNKDVELGKKYKFSMTFAEGDEHKQFVLNTEGKLVYTFPKGLKIQDKSSFPVFAGQNRVGVFEIKNNQLIFTPFYTENGKDFFEDSSKGTSFVDYYGNAWLNFEFEGEFDGKQGSTTIQFGNGVELNVNVKVPTTPPRAEVTKNSELSADKTKISYTINAKVLDADANTFKITDRVQSGTAIGAMSGFTVMLKKADGTLEPVPAEHYSVVHHRNGEGDYTGFDLEFTQKPIPKDTEYEIKYDVALNLDDLKGEYKNVTVGANYVKANADDGWNDKTTPGYQFEGKKKVGKDFVSADSKTQTVKWKLTIGNGTEAVSGATATDSWTPLAQGIDAMELTDDTITIKLYKGFAETDENLLQTIRVKKGDPDFSSYFTVTTDGNGKETGFEFKTPNHAEAKRCTVEYATKVTRNESHKDSWLTVTNDASSEGDSDGGSGTLGPNQEQQTAKAEVLEKTATTDSDYITYTVKVMVPKERIGKPLGLSDRLRWSQNTNNQWGKQSIFNNPEDIEIVGVGLTTRKQIAFTKGKVAEGETNFKFTLTQDGNLDSFRILFNVPEDAWDPEKFSKWLWPLYTDDDGNEQNEDVELTITYKISWDTLVAKGTDVKNLEQFDDGKLKDIDTGFVVNYAYTDGSGAFHNLNRTKTMRKEGDVTDPANGIITYTIHINPEMNAQIDGTPLIDDFDSRYLEYVAGSFKVEYRLALWNSWTVGGDLIATIHGEPEIDAAAGKMTFDFDWVSSEATKSNWTCDDTKLYHIYGDERFNGLQNDSKWYQKWIAGYQSHGYTPYFKVSYQLRVKNTSVGNLSLKNTASIEGYNTVTKWIDYSPRYVTKESAYNESERELTYTLKVNEQGKTINNGAPLTLKDEMSNATPDLSSIVVKELGSGQTLAKSEWSVTYALNAQGHSVMEITLPDSKALEVTYKAYPNSPTNGATGVNVTNKATLNGVVTTTDEDGKWVTVHTGSGAAGGEHPIVFIMKVDESSQPLSGATFKLEMLRRNSEGGAWYWVEIGEKTTDGTGLLRFESTPDKTFYPDRLFRFTETQAPSGYTGISEPYYFYIKDKGIEAEQLTFAGVTGNQVHEQGLWYQTAVIPNERKVGAEFEFAKVNEQNAPLAQAEFSLTEWNGSAAVGSTKTAVSGANGLVHFENLERGKTYLLTETKAAPGYLRSGEKWLVTVNAEGQITVIIHGGTAGQQPSTITLEGKDVRAFVNRGVPQLPTTGGNGTLAYSVCGVTLMTISAAMLGAQARRRRRKEEN